MAAGERATTGLAELKELQEQPLPRQYEFIHLHGGKQSVYIKPEAKMDDKQQNEKRVEHHFLTVLPDLSAVETDLMRLLNDFNNNKLKRYGNKDLNETLFRKMDAVRDKQEKIARTHFEQDIRMTESKLEGEDQKVQSKRDMEDLTRQLDELSNSIHELQPAI